MNLGKERSVLTHEAFGCIALCHEVFEANSHPLYFSVEHRDLGLCLADEFCNLSRLVSRRRYILARQCGEREDVLEAGACLCRRKSTTRAFYSHSLETAKKQSHKKGCLPIAIVVYANVGVLVVAAGDSEAIATRGGVARHCLHDHSCK